MQILKFAFLYFIERIPCNKQVPWFMSVGISSCDFFLWGWMKHRVYANPMTHLGELRHQIEEAFASLPHWMVERAVVAYKGRLQRCISVGGGSVEKLQLTDAWLHVLVFSTMCVPHHVLILMLLSAMTSIITHVHTNFHSSGINLMQELCKSAEK